MSGSIGEIKIFSDIGPDDWGFFGGETVDRMLKEMDGVESIDVLINSPGGMVHEGMAVYNLLANHPAKVNVKVLGVAASAASFVAMAGDTITMAGNARMMVHNPWSMAMGEAKDLRKEAEVLDGFRDDIVKTYAARTGQKAAKVVKMMDDETWMSAEEAQKMGFADEVAELKKAGNSIDWTKARDRYDYKKIPRELFDRITTPANVVKLARPDWLKKHLTTAAKSA